MSRHSILIVEDETDTRWLLRMLFERQGFNVHWAGDGEEAIDAARQYNPDIILMDVQMPRKTGIEAAAELRADPRFADTPMIALTAYARVFLPSDVFRAGFNEVLFKPYELSQIEALVAKYIGM